MARVVRADTGESIGYFVELYGPLEPGARGWICDAWRYADGSLHLYAESPGFPAAPAPALTHR